MMNNILPKVTISIVSHGHGSEINHLLAEIQNYCSDYCKVIITLNIPEVIPVISSASTYPIQFIHNEKPKGFAENHNAAFRFCDTDYFCVMNPDIRLKDNPFPELIKHFSVKETAITAPIVVNDKNEIQDNARRFPTPLHILKRVITKNRFSDYLHDLQNNKMIYPDWVAGMFMLFSSVIYKKINGFDEKYFLYCEDIDICYRLKKLNYKILCDSSVRVQHNAHRDSHKKIKYLIWHIKSLSRFFIKTTCSNWTFKHERKS